MKLTKIDSIMKRKLVHAQDTRVEKVHDSLDINLDIEDQLKLLKSLALDLHLKGLTIKQKVLCRATINELRIKFKHLGEEERQTLFQEYAALGLRELLMNDD